MLPLRPIIRFAYRYRVLLSVLAVIILLIEPYHHATSIFKIQRPTYNLDPPFSATCLDPAYAAANSPRQSAAFVMLARNSDVEGAVTAVRSVEARFNRWFHYPYVFLNNEPWSASFKSKVQAEVSGEVEFETIPSYMWDWSPRFKDNEAAKAHARANWAQMDKATGVRHGSYLQNENYHHMCRFNSGFFFDHPALLKYRWYWRLEPDVSFTCDITYDPFAAMAVTNKTYGYTIALWEVGSTAKSLFRTVSDYIDERVPGLAATGLRPTWTAMHDASWAPWPIRRLFISNMLHSRTQSGDAWNFCHFWSNFEIADLDFFRSDEYRALFERLDAAGGFHYERWGDAPVHSIAAALLLEPQQLHYFQDIGYVHPPFQHCPRDEEVGCRCQCDPGVGSVPDVCLRRLRLAVEPDEAALARERQLERERNHDD